jgi:signal transduction histidine kinase
MRAEGVGARAMCQSERSVRRLERGYQARTGSVGTIIDVSTTVRNLSDRLHPSRLQLIGLVAALDRLRRELPPAHLSVAFAHHNVPAVIDQDIALCFFRVAQEALGNAVKHSDAGHACVELTGTPSSLQLVITDDGKGFDVDSVPNGGLGLMSMRERERNPSAASWRLTRLLHREPV